MRRTLFALLAVLLGGSAAQAETLLCQPNSYTDWAGGEANAHPIGDEERAAGFTLDLKTGAYHQHWNDGTDPVDVTYELISWGAYGDEGAFVAWDKATQSVIRIRLTNEELQFMHNHDWSVDIGICSFVSRERQYERPPGSPDWAG